MIKRRTYYTIFAAFSLIYILATLIAPLAPNRFNLSVANTRLIQIGIAVPVVLIWFAAVYGAERFNSYARSIANSKDGKALNQIGSGLTMLAVAVMSNGISGTLRPWALRDGWIENFVISYNYLQVVLYLAAFYLIYKGTVMLRAVVAKKPENLSAWVPVIIIIGLVGLLYVSVILGYDHRNDSPDPTKFSSYYLPDSLILSTLALPFLVGWALGIKSALNVAFYYKKVKGIIYKSALNRFATGMYLVVAFAVILQMLIAFSTYFAKAGLKSILLIVYLILISYSLGFLVIASGSKKLNAIEKVNL